MKLWNLLKESADEVADVVAPVVSAVNPFAGILVKLVGGAIEKIDDVSQDDGDRTELSLRFAAYLMRVGAAITDAAADGELTEAEFAQIKEELLDLDL